MPPSKGTRAYQQGARLVVTDATDIDAAQVSGRWIASTDVREVRR